jgi:hypothetical protein
VLILFFGDIKMRVLNAKQKKMIDKWFDENWKGAGSITSSDNMNIELLDEIMLVNDHETFWSNIDRYINDKACDRVYNKYNK